MSQKNVKTSTWKNYDGDAHFYPDQPYNDGLEKTSKKNRKKLAKLIKKRKEEIKNDLIQKIGKLYVQIQTNGGKTRYLVGCPMRNCDYKGEQIYRHLIGRNHKWAKIIASLFTSMMIRNYSHYTKIRRSSFEPLPCLLCFRYQSRLRTHIRTTHGIKKDKNIKHILKRAKHFKENILQKLFVGM